MHANINGSEAFAEVGEGPEVVGPNTKVQLCIISIAKQLLSRRPRGTAYKQTKTGPKIHTRSTNEDISVNMKYSPDSPALFNLSTQIQNLCLTVLFSNNVFKACVPKYPQKSSKPENSKSFKGLM